ncbi:MAG: cereblon family protein, partial [Desulfobacterales bacterium]
MEIIESNQISLLRERAPKKDGSSTPELAEEEAPEQEPEEEEYILCRQCRQAITRPAERIAVQGSHQHTFANPHGIVFEIGCFKSAQGCGYAGAPSTEFTWF